MRHHLRVTIPFLFLTATLGAQSVLKIDATYHYGESAVEVPNSNSSPGSQTAVFAGRGDVTFRQDLSFDSTIQTRDVFADGTAASSTENDAGVYTVQPDSKLVLDFDPSLPGTDVWRLFTNVDASLIVGARDYDDIDGAIWIMLPKSTGMSNASASGQYAIVSSFWFFDSGLLESGVAKGIATLDGAGNFTFAGSEQSIAGDGTSSVQQVNDSGTYTIGADGTFSLSGTEIGGISADGDIFFFVSQETDEVGLSVAIRIGSSLTADQVAGTWAFGYQEGEFGVAVDRPNAYTELGAITLADVSPTTGSYDGSSTEVESNPTGVTRQPSAFSGNFDMTSGRIRLNPTSTTPSELWVSQDHDLLLGSNFHGSADLFLGLRICGGSDWYGAPTPGAGGIAPVQSMSTFPTIGNAGFELTVTNGLGGAPGVTALALRPSAGIPLFLGLLHLDTNFFVTTFPLALSGAAGTPGVGAANVLLPMPPDPVFAGVPLYAQSVMFDQAAVGWFSMTSGLRFRLCDL